MLGLIAAFLFAGYTLVYAAVANGGKFAAQPWQALLGSAYDGAGSSTTTAPGGHSGALGSVWGAIVRGIVNVPAGGLGGLLP